MITGKCLKPDIPVPTVYSNCMTNEEVNLHQNECIEYLCNKVNELDERVKKLEEKP